MPDIMSTTTNTSKSVGNSTTHNMGDTIIGDANWTEEPFFLDELPPDLLKFYRAAKCNTGAKSASQSSLDNDVIRVEAVYSLEIQELKAQFTALQATLKQLTDQVGRCPLFKNRGGPHNQHHSKCQSFTDRCLYYKYASRRCQAPCLMNGKVAEPLYHQSQGPVRVATILTRPRLTGRLFVADSINKLFFLIDSGSEVCVFPRQFIADKDIQQDPAFLEAANKSPINSYGLHPLRVCLGLRRLFKWNFVIADVPNPIIGADFIKKYNLLIDLPDLKLIDKTTGISVKGFDHTTSTPSVKTVDSQNQFYPLLIEHPDLIDTSEEPRMANHTTLHRIPTKSGNPVCRKFRKLRLPMLEKANAYYQRLLERGIVRRSSSSYASPLHVVSKGEDEDCFCGDYTELNRMTILDSYPKKNVPDFNLDLEDCAIFSTLHLSNVTHLIPVHPDDVHKTAVITPLGLLEYIFMPMGLKNASQTLQRFMDSITQDLPFVFAFLHDILVASKHVEEHKEHLKILFKRLEDSGLRFNLKKCRLGVPEVIFNGFQINAQGLLPLKEKVEAVLDIKPPTTLGYLRNYVGIINFYHRYLPDIAELLAPLTILLSGPKFPKKAPLELQKDQLKAFEESKYALANIALLAQPKAGATLALICNASDLAVGGTLKQLNDDDWQPLAFFSRKLRAAEQNYSTYDKELLAIFVTIHKFKHFLAKRVFSVYTYHKPLIYSFMKNKQDCSPHQCRHLDFIGQYTTDIRHIRGSSDILADTLSRISAVNEPFHLQNLAQEQQTDPELLELCNHNPLKLARFHMPGYDDLKLWCDVSKDNPRPYITPTFRKQAFYLVYDPSSPGAKTATKMVSVRFFWPRMKEDCKIWARACRIIQTTKIISKQTGVPLKYTPSYNERFRVVHVDIVGQLELSNEYKFVLTCIDNCTRWVEAVPLTDITTESVAHAFFTGWICRFGCPETVVCVEGPIFKSSVFKQFADLFGFQIMYKSMFHPQALEMIERLQKTLKNALTCYNSEWSTALHLVLMGLRAVLWEDLQCSPAELVYGAPIRLPGSFLVEEPIAQPDDSSILPQIQRIMEQLQPTPATTHSRQQSFVHPELNNCTHCYVQTDAVNCSLQSPYTGPHQVVDRGPITFSLLIGNKLESIPIDRLRPAPMLPENLPLPRPTKPEPPPEEIHFQPRPSQTAVNTNGPTRPTQYGLVTIPDHHQPPDNAPIVNPPRSPATQTVQVQNSIQTQKSSPPAVSNQPSTARRRRSVHFPDTLDYYKTPQF